ncbi:MAG: beta-galactosidase [Bacteroidales bacterium]|nr:beta-galactosidase [Bacteroidales bacterium]
MKHLSLAALILLLASCAAGTTTDSFCRVENGQFLRDGAPYYYVGTNFWYGPILASDAEGGNWDRLTAELDSLKALGIDNLRVLAGADGPDGIPSKVEPTMMKEPGVYDERLFVGLDRFLAELDKRDMHAVLYLNNSWEWSGGYWQYLEWAGAGHCIIPAVEGWREYMATAWQFITNEKAKELFADHIRTVVSRVNTVSGLAYKDDPAIFSWQICNEPRCFSHVDSVQTAFADWLWSTAALIKSLDPNHMVSTGSEGKWGCEGRLDLFEKIHSCPDIDYLTIHIWPYNWQWITQETVREDAPAAIDSTAEYLDMHIEVARRLDKPVVVEEFGYPRDGFRFAKGTPTEGRDSYYDYIFSRVVESASEGDVFAGVNFWGWGGLAEQSTESIDWQKGDDYCGDPAQEQQGLNSVYLADRSTVEVITKATLALKTLLSAEDNDTEQTVNTANATGDASLSFTQGGREELLASLKSWAGVGKVLYGHQDDPCYGHAWRSWDLNDWPLPLADDGSEPTDFADKPEVPVRAGSDVADVCGDAPAVVGFDLGGIELGRLVNIDGVPFDLIREAAVRQYEAGGVVTFSWHPRNPLTGGDSWDISSKNVVAGITGGGAVRDTMLVWLGRAADFLASLRTAEGEPIPVIFRPWHEHTGSWFWWGRDLCSVEQYVALWHLTYDYLVGERGLTKLVWAYSPGAVSDEVGYMERYPGDEVVDILGVDCYQYGKSMKKFTALLDKSLALVSGLAQEHGKVAALTESGYEGIPDAAWWTKGLYKGLKNHPVAYVLTWRNAWDRPGHYFGPWEGSADAENFRAFHKLPGTVFLNDLRN